jgi:hypothetical protein
VERSLSAGGIPSADQALESEESAGLPQERLAVDQIGHLTIPHLISTVFDDRWHLSRNSVGNYPQIRARHLCMTALSISGRFLDVIDDVILDGALLRLQFQPKLLL